MLLVGYIAPNATLGTVSGIDGSISIKAFFDKAVKGHYILLSATPSKNQIDDFNQPGKRVLKLNKRFLILKNDYDS